MYVLQQDRLQPFDILLVRFPDDQQSLDIREYCNSEFSHAVVYLGDGSFIEGIEPVVSLFSYHRYYFPDLDNVRLLRLNDDLQQQFDFIDAERFIRSLSSSNYSKRLLIYLRNRNIDQSVIESFQANQRWHGGIVCTSLVTLPYYIGGVDFSNSDEPYYANFHEIENFDGFVDVTDETFTRIAPEELRDDSFNYLTAYETTSLLERQAEIVSELNAYVENKFNDIRRNPHQYEDINIVEENLQFNSWEDMFPNIMRWFLTETGQEIDKELSEMIIDSKFHLLWFEEIHRYPKQYFPLYYGTHPHNFFPQIENLEFIKEMLESTNERIEHNERATFHNFSKCPSRTFHVLLDMYRSFSDLLRSSITQYDALIENYDRLQQENDVQ